MLPSALRRKSDSPAGKKGNAAGLAALTKEEPPAAQSVVATTSPVPAAPAAAAPVVDKTAAAPQRPPPRPSDAGAVPQLNRYVRSQLPKGEVSSTASLYSNKYATGCCTHDTHMLSADRDIPRAYQSFRWDLLLSAAPLHLAHKLFIYLLIHRVFPSRSADLKHADAFQVSPALLARRVTRLFYQ